MPNPNRGEVVARFQPRSRGLPAGLLDQPLYGWVQDAQTRILQSVSTGFVEEALAVMLKRLIGSTLKRADSLNAPALPSAQSAGLRTLRESRLKPASSRGSLGGLLNQANVDTVWYQTNLDVFLNRWFSNYEDARRARASDGGFLLPYKRHLFVCEAEVISAMGLEPDDPDWEEIKWDGAQPLDIEAYQRLREKRGVVQGR